MMTGSLTKALDRELLQTQQHKEGLEQFYRLHEYGPPWKVLHDLGRELIKKIILT